MHSHPNHTGNMRVIQSRLIDEGWRGEEGNRNFFLLQEFIIIWEWGWAVPAEELHAAQSGLQSPRDMSHP